MGWEYVGGCNIARGAEGDNNANKFGRSRKSPGPFAHSRYTCSPTFFRPPDSPVPYVVAMSSARAPPINSDAKLVPETHQRPLRVKKGNLGVEVRLNKEYCPEIDVMTELAKGKLPSSRLQFTHPDLFPKVREAELGQPQELHHQGPTSLVNACNICRVHAPSVPWRYLQRSFQSPPCSPKGFHPTQQDHVNCHQRETADPMRSTRDAQCQTICDAGVQTDSRACEKLRKGDREGDCVDALSLKTSSSNVSLVSLGIHVDVVDSEECGRRNTRVSSKARVSPRLPRQRKAVVGRKKVADRSSTGTDCSKGKTGTLGKHAEKDKKRKKKARKGPQKVFVESRKPGRVGSGSGEDKASVKDLDLASVHIRRPSSEVLNKRSPSGPSNTASPSTSDRNSCPDLDSSCVDQPQSPKSVLDAESHHGNITQSNSSLQSGGMDFPAAPPMPSKVPVDFGIPLHDFQNRPGGDHGGSSVAIRMGNRTTPAPFGTSVDASSGVAGTAHLPSARVLESKREARALTSQHPPPGGNVPTIEISPHQDYVPSANNVLELTPGMSFPASGVEPSTATPQLGYESNFEKSPALEPTPRSSMFATHQVDPVTDKNSRRQEEGRNSLESLAELERLIEEQHMQLVARGILQPDDDVLESSVDNVPNPDAEILDKHLRSIRKVAFDPNHETAFSDQKNDAGVKINSELLQGWPQGKKGSEAREHPAQKTKEARDLEAELSRNLEELLDVSNTDETSKRWDTGGNHMSGGPPATPSRHTRGQAANGQSMGSFSAEDCSESDLSESLLNLLEDEPRKELDAGLGCPTAAASTDVEEIDNKCERASIDSRQSSVEEDARHCLRRECQYDCSCSYSVNEDSVDGSSHMAGMVASVAAVAMRSNLDRNNQLRDPGVFNVDIIQQCHC